MASEGAKNIVVDNDEPLIQVPKGKRTLFFLILYGLFVMDFIARVGINAIFPVIQGDLQLTDSQVGTLGSVVLLGMAALVLPVSFLGEKYSPKKLISLSALVWSLGSLLSGMASSFSLLLCSRFMVGAGNSAYAPLSNSMITSMYKKSQWGKQIGLYNTAMTLGMALGAIVFANLASTFGWRMAFYVVGILSMILTLASLALPDTKKQMATQTVEQPKKENQVSIKMAVKVVGKNKALLGVCLGAGFACMALQAIMSWQSIYFVRVMGMSVEKAAAIVSLSAIVTALGYPIGGAIMDKWYQRDKRCRAWLPAICCLLSATCLVIGFYMMSVPLMMVAMLCFAMGNTAFHASTQELVPSWFKSVSYGVYVLFIQFLGAMGPICAGFLSEKLGLVNALMSMQIFLVLAAVILVLSGMAYMKNYNQARKTEQAAGNTIGA